MDNRVGTDHGGGGAGENNRGNLGQLKNSKKKK